MLMTIVPVTPPRRSLRLSRTGDTSVAIVEASLRGGEESVELRSAGEAVALIAALIVAFDVPISTVEGAVNAARVYAKTNEGASS